MADQKKTSTEAPAKKQGAKKEEAVQSSRIGIVESDSRTRTRKVVVNFLSRHPKYGKYIRRRTVLQVHDEQNASRTGDVVEVVPCRPVSKTKSWRLSRVVESRVAKTAALASAKAQAEQAIERN